MSRADTRPPGRGPARVVLVGLAATGLWFIAACSPLTFRQEIIHAQDIQTFFRDFAREALAAFLF